MTFRLTGRSALVLVPILLVLLLGYSIYRPPKGASKSNSPPTTLEASLPKAPTRTTRVAQHHAAQKIQKVRAYPTTDITSLSRQAILPTLASTAIPTSQPTDGSLPTLGDFIHNVSDGQPDQVRGIYVDGTLALRVVQQPAGDSGYISAEDGTATQFQEAASFGVTGLLAHNFLSGRKFFNLVTGQSLRLIFGDGHQKSYRVSQIDDYQRLSVNDLRSDFRAVQSGEQSTADEVFSRYYQGAPHLILQTCIEKDGLWTWGVRFIRADPTP